MSYMAETGGNAEKVCVPTDAPSSSTEQSPQFLARLDRDRTRMVRTVMELREICESANAAISANRAGADAADHAQLRLSAAVGDLDDVDGRLHEARLQQGTSEKLRRSGFQ